ncbi:hypothetical protein ACMAZF_03025 [Psychrobium sp. nBUS_13]|uniref:hypothetical protein n=1 Tax=Psychrobium sp. nBUS_13 TaxID=3395319 RepID=UPI003EB6BAC0
MTLLIVGLLSMAPFVSDGKVISHSENSFELSSHVVINQPVESIFQRFNQIELWWHSDHTFSGNAQNMTLDITDACFCERWANNIIRHMDIVAVEEKKRHVWRGGLGPLQFFAVSGALTWDFKSIGNNQTSVTYTYRVYGAIPDAKTWSTAVDGVLPQQLTRLKNSIK